MKSLLGQLVQLGGTQDRGVNILSVPDQIGTVGNYGSEVLQAISLLPSRVAELSF